MTTRREFLKSGGSAFTAVTATASIAVADSGRRRRPNLCRHQAHKAAAKTLDRLLDGKAVLEKSLPKGRRRSMITVSETVIEPSDAPGWIANEHAVHVACNLEKTATLALLETPPTSLAGVAAILEYAAAYTRDVNEWPELVGAANETSAPRRHGRAGSTKCLPRRC